MSNMQLTHLAAKKLAKAGNWLAGWKVAQKCEGFNPGTSFNTWKSWMLGLIEEESASTGKQWDALSGDAKVTAMNMIKHCIERGECMGMDEGMILSDENSSDTPQKFRSELEKFSGWVDV
jgi:hypothetical protein